eukprot:7427198-Heterocapsa_arctica.AAC.1
MNTKNKQRFYNSYMVKYWPDTKTAMLKVTPKDGIKHDAKKRPRDQSEPERKIPPAPMAHTPFKGIENWAQLQAAEQNQWGQQIQPNIGPNATNLWNIQEGKGYQQPMDMDYGQSSSPKGYSGKGRGPPQQQWSNKVKGKEYMQQQWATNTGWVEPQW